MQKDLEGAARHTLLGAPAEQEDPEGPTPMEQARVKTDEPRP